MLSAAFVAGLGTLAGCTDSDFDLSQVDMTVGLGNGELSLPVSSTDTILLSDVLKLNDSKTVVEQENGDYYFQQEGEVVNPTSVSIQPVTVMKSVSSSADLNISLADYLTSVNTRAAINLQQEAKVQTFSYQGTMPEEVVELKNAQVSNHLTLSVNFSEALRAYVPSIDELTLELPAYMTLSDIRTSATCTQQGSKLVLSQVSTAQPLQIAFSISALDFTQKATELGKLEVADGKVNLEASIRMGVTIRDINLTVTGQDPTRCAISTSLSMGDAVKLTQVSGRFDPVINLSNLGSAAITGIPDFLTNDGVVIDLANPQILVDIESDLTVAGIVDGQLTATKDGVVTATVNIPSMQVQAATTSRFCICRDRAATVAPGRELIEVPSLSTLLNPIPDRISFSANAAADSHQAYSFELGKEYTLTPSYEIVAPIAFGSNARIVYTERFDEFNDDIEDFDVAEGTYLLMTADLENRIPAYLNVEAVAIDIHGKEMPESLVKVEVTGEVKASPDGVNSTTSAIQVKLTPQKGALKTFDGMKLTVSGAAQSSQGDATVVGKTLNAKKHSLVAKNIQIKLVGKAIADLN